MIGHDSFNSNWTREKKYMKDIILCLIPVAEKNHSMNLKTIKRVHLREEEFRKNPEKQWDEHFNRNEINQSIVEYCNEFFILGYAFSSLFSQEDLIQYLKSWTTQLLIDNLEDVSHFQTCENGICFTKTSDFLISLNEETHQWIHIKSTPQVKPSEHVKLIQDEKSIKDLKNKGFLVYNYKEY